MYEENLQDYDDRGRKDNDIYIYNIIHVFPAEMRASQQPSSTE